MRSILWGMGGVQTWWTSGGIADILSNRQKNTTPVHLHIAKWDMMS